MDTLSNDLIRQYRAIGHKLKPIVTIAAKGLTENVRMELERALNDHELIKVKVHTGDRELKKSLIETICRQTNANLVQTIGHTALIFREADQPNLKLSNIRR